jgi:hypothetical protein
MVGAGTGGHVAAAQAAWPVWGALAWSLAFGLLGLAWAAGADLALGTLAREIEAEARAGDPGLRQVTLLAALAKLGGGLLAVASLRVWASRRGRVVLLSLLWGLGFLYALYGVVGLLEKLFMAAGLLAVPDGLGEDRVVWYLLLWEPVWLAGGALFLRTAWRYNRITRAG